MGMRVGLVRLFATVLLLSTPAIVMAAPVKESGKKTEKVATQKTGAKAKVVKAKAGSAKSAKSKYNAPIYASIVIDVATGQVLSEANADRKSYPASLTKMMTLYLLFDALQKREVHMDTAIPVSVRAANAAPSKLNLQPKQTITVEQAIQALITKSANDVAVAVGEHLGGTEEAFAAKMTAKARAIGMSQTTFKNANGLPNPAQFSTARDMATLGMRLMKDFPQYYGEFARMEFDYKGQTIRTHNHLLEFYEGADGIKTGYTAASGFNLVASATRNGYRIIGVMFGGASASSRDQRLAALMDQGFSTLSGQPETAIAAKESDRIAQQIALASQPATEDEAEQGDREEPYQPATHADRSTIETTSLAPLPAVPQATAPEAAAPQTAPRQLAVLDAPAPSVKPAPSLSAVPPQAPAPAAKTTEPSSWGIQVGAYAARSAAETQATTSAVKLKPTFNGATALVVPVKVKGKTMYRARIVGLPSDELVKACSVLRKQAKAGCQAVPPERNRVAAR
jgi:D-alanyl-D-alanine carboxypeptidase